MSTVAQENQAHPTATEESREKPERLADPCVMVIFGASGDLTKRKLIPALYNLARDNFLADEFVIVGISRTELSHEEFRTKIASDLDASGIWADDPALRQKLLDKLYYIAGDAVDPQLYKKLSKFLTSIDKEHATQGNYFFYLSTDASLFAPIIHRLGESGLAREENGKWRRVIIEKPFGRDLDSAKKLNLDIKEVLSEGQIYRIDHYLGKETVQNLLVFRFGNGIFEPVWNRRFIDHVQITVAEELGIEQRGDFYETAGALRDMVPNHIFQLLSLTAMEPPVSFEADALHDEQVKVLHALQPLSEENVIRRAVRGQYGSGKLHGVETVAYRAEPKVAPDSNTETFFALKLLIDNWRWADIPFYVRTGKRMNRRLTEIVIQFRPAPYALFRDSPIDRLEANKIVVHIQPDEGISLSFGAKIPGPLVNIGNVDMDFRYRDYFGSKPSTGYERLLYDCMIGDATLFQRADMVECGWKVVAPIQEYWDRVKPNDFPNYAPGSWGPEAATELLSRDGRRWRNAG